MRVTDTRAVLDGITRCVFGVSLHDHEVMTGREIVACLIRDSAAPLRCEPLFGTIPREVTSYVNQHHFGRVAGTYVDCGSDFGFAPSVDLLMFADRLFDKTEDVIYGVMFHEICHLVDAPRFAHGLGATEADAVQASLRILKFHDPGPFRDGVHTEMWAALLFTGSSRLARCFRHLFADHESALNAALSEDVPDSRLVGLAWSDPKP